MALFGKCNNPFGHGHDYTLSVTVAGEPSAETGLIIPVSELDRLVENHVLKIFGHRNLNMDVPQLKDVVPTTENVAVVVANILKDKWQAFFGNRSGARLARVRLQETERNGFEIDLATRRLSPVSASHHESMPVNV